VLYSIGTMIWVTDMGHPGLVDAQLVRLRRRGRARRWLRQMAGGGPGDPKSFAESCGFRLEALALALEAQSPKEHFGRTVPQYLARPSSRCRRLRRGILTLWRRGITVAGVRSPEAE